MRHTLMVATLAAATPALAGDAISIPTDPSATYEVLELERRADGLVEVVTKRVGPSGTSYAKRQVDCRAMTFRYLGDGDTLEAMEASRPSPDMGPLVSGSISYYVSVHACENAD